MGPWVWPCQPGTLSRRHNWWLGIIKKGFKDSFDQLEDEHDLANFRFGQTWRRRYQDSNQVLSFICRLQGQPGSGSKKIWAHQKLGDELFFIFETNQNRTSRNIFGQKWKLPFEKSDKSKIWPRLIDFGLRLLALITRDWENNELVIPEMFRIIF